MTARPRGIGRSKAKSDSFSEIPRASEHRENAVLLIPLGAKERVETQEEARKPGALLAWVREN